MLKMVKIGGVQEVSVLRKREQDKRYFNIQKDTDKCTLTQSNNTTTDTLQRKAELPAQRRLNRAVAWGEREACRSYRLLRAYRSVPGPDSSQNPSSDPGQVTPWSQETRSRAYRQSQTAGRSKVSCRSVVNRAG